MDGGRAEPPGATGIGAHLDAGRCADRPAHAIAGRGDRPFLGPGHDGDLGHRACPDAAGPRRPQLGDPVVARHQLGNWQFGNRQFGDWPAGSISVWGYSAQLGGGDPVLGGFAGDGLPIGRSGHLVGAARADRHDWNRLERCSQHAAVHDGPRRGEQPRGDERSICTGTGRVDGAVVLGTAVGVGHRPCADGGPDLAIDAAIVGAHSASAGLAVALDPDAFVAGWDVRGRWAGGRDFAVGPSGHDQPVAWATERGWLRRRPASSEWPA